MFAATGDSHERDGAPKLFDRAIRRIAAVWRDMAAGVGREEDDSIPAQMRACLAGRGGEVSARNRAAKLAQAYLASTRRPARLPARPGRLRLRPRRRGGRLGAGAGGRPTRPPAPPPRRGLRRALEPPRLRLLTQFGTIPDGVRFLVELRAFLLRSAAGDPYSPPWRATCAACWRAGSMSASWNCAGSTGPARPSLLEKLVGYEAVHEIRGWRDLKNRLDSDRRCYAFFHPRMPDEPLIFVEVALVKGLAGIGAGPARPAGAAARPGAGRHRHLLFDQQLPAGPGRHQLRQFPDQAGGGPAVGRIPQPPPVRHPVAGPGFSPLARCAKLARGRAGPVVGGGKRRAAHRRARRCAGGGDRGRRAGRHPGAAAVFPQRRHAEGGRAGAGAPLRRATAERSAAAAGRPIRWRISICPTAPASSASAWAPTPPRRARRKVRR